MLKDNVKTLIEKTFIESAKNNKGFPLVEIHSNKNDSIEEAEIKIIQMKDISDYIEMFEKDEDIFLGITYSNVGPRIQFRKE